jgi:hypothetical protein
MKVIQRSITRPKSPSARHSDVCFRHWMLVTGCLIILCLSAKSASAPTNDLPALVPAYAEMPATYWEQHRVAYLVVVPFLAALGLAMVLWWLKPKPQLVASPATVARDALARFQGKPEDGDRLSAVSQILRRYCNERFCLSLGELTTAEFITALEHTDKLSASVGESLSDFLRELDVRKFSPVDSPAPLNAVEWALEFVNQAEQATATTPEL